MEPLPFGINPNYFPAKLWRLVNNPSVDSIFWDRFGELVVIDKALFQVEILGVGGFKTTNFSSFVRQLNLYGFKKVRHVEDDHCYQYFVNPNFRRDQPELVAKLWRLTVDNKAKVRAGLGLDAPGPSGGADGDPDVRRSPVTTQYPQSDQGADLPPFIPAPNVIPPPISQLSPDAASSEKGSLACADTGSLHLIRFNPYNAQYFPRFYYSVSPYFHPNLVPGSEHQTWLLSPQSYYQVTDETMPCAPRNCPLKTVTPVTPEKPSNTRRAALCTGPASIMQENMRVAAVTVSETGDDDGLTDESVISVPEHLPEDAIL